MDNPKISVIVPVYNVEQYLPRCIDSILDQTFTDFEVLLIDDGSTDSSGDICDEYAKKDNRIKVFHKENGGVSSARNCGINFSRGELISFIDSDDWLKQNCLQEIVTNMVDVDLLVFSYTWIFYDGSTRTVTPKEMKVEEVDKIEYFILCMRHNNTKENMFGYPWNKVFRREIIKHYNITFEEGLHYCEDEIFVLSYCLKIRKAKSIPISLYYHWLRNDSLSYNKLQYSEWMHLVSCIDKLIPLLHYKNLQQEYRMWRFQTFLNACKSKMFFLKYLRQVYCAYKYAKANNIKKYKEHIVKNILLKIRTEVNK